mmetsp:Transcript_13142/g.34373  ORF Transcript_13142/g.34373 Transcript_13142/m.34373 type:complete len:220 (-) Transcript_13142:1338-1997(-)
MTKYTVDVANVNMKDREERVRSCSDGHLKLSQPTIFTANMRKEMTSTDRTAPYMMPNTVFITWMIMAEVLSFRKISVSLMTVSTNTNPDPTKKVMNATTNMMLTTSPNLIILCPYTLLFFSSAALSASPTAISRKRMVSKSFFSSSARSLSTPPSLPATSRPRKSFPLVLLLTPDPTAGEKARRELAGSAPFNPLILLALFLTEGWMYSGRSDSYMPLL